MTKSLEFERNISLGSLTTMQLGSSRANYFYNLTSAEDLPKIHLFAVENGLRIRILAGGSNSLATDQDFDGIIIKNSLIGIKKTTVEGWTHYQVASGEIWDDFVAQTTTEGMTGLECTSGVPGTVGATPVQNVGAYGQEISESMTEFEAYDFIDNRFVTIKTHELEFAYRTSTLKTHNINRYFITSVSFKLKPGELTRPFYWSLEKYATEQQLTDFSPAQIREAVLAIRAVRIPDYHTHPSAGSFFENAEIPPAKFEQIKQDHPDIPYGEPQPSGLVKIPTGWLISKTGLAGQTLHGINVTAHNPMILVNQSAASFTDLMKAQQEIIAAIKQKFDIDIELEPVVIS